MKTKAVTINEIVQFAAVEVLEPVVSEPTGNALRKVTLEMEITGKSLLDEIVSQTDSPFPFRIQDDDVEFRAVRENYSWSYNGTTLDDHTAISLKLFFSEQDKDLPEGHDFQTALYADVIMARIRTRALSELMVSKGIIKMSEYEDMIRVISDRDHENLVKYYMYGIPEPSRNE